MDGLSGVLAGLAVPAFGLAAWAMGVKQAAAGRGRFGCMALGLAFALFQLVVMGVLIGLDTWWSRVVDGVLLIATVTMFLDALVLRHPDSRAGAWWAAQGAAAAVRREARKPGGN